MSLTADDLRSELERARRRRVDPFRPHLQFLVGLATFSLGILIGVFAALPKDSAKLTANAAAMLGGVLAWMSVAALTAALAALFVQIVKGVFNWRDRGKEASTIPACSVVLLWIVSVLPIVPGAVAVSYCLRAGAAMLNASPSLQGFFGAVQSLF